jgi:AraC-like DNA-binding protein
MARERRQPILDYLLENYRRDLSIGEAAHELGLSASALRAKFGAQHGKPPLQYLTELRMARALELLRDGKHSVGAVAEMVGIPNPDRFRRTFRRYYGFPPSQFKADSTPAAVAVPEDALACYTFDRPVPVTAHPDHQIKLISEGRLIRCSDAYARLYGAMRAKDVIGLTVEQMVPFQNAYAREGCRRFIREGYRVEQGVGTYQRDGKPVLVRANVSGVIRDGALIEAWGSVVELERAEE